MKEFLKQLFCIHIWRQVGKDSYLRTNREFYGMSLILGVPSYANFEYYARNQQCVKCNKTRVVEVRAIVI